MNGESDYKGGDVYIVPMPQEQVLKYAAKLHGLSRPWDFAEVFSAEWHAWHMYCMAERYPGRTPELVAIIRSDAKRIEQEVVS